MAREKGTVSFSANFEAQKASPVDARMLCGAKSDLTTASTWQANDGSTYAYVGMVVSVAGDPTPSNDGVYRLASLPLSAESSWASVGSSPDAVTGPLSATADALVVFSDTTGKLVKASSAIPNGTTATTQSVGNNSTLVATTAFVLANAAAGSGDVVGPSGATDGTIPLFDTATGKKIKGSAYTPGSFEAANANIQSHISNTTSAHGLTIANVTNAGNTFNGASQLVQLTAAAKYPALDGSLITNLAGASSTFNITYAAHGLTTGALSPVVPIARVGSSYAQAKADSAANVEVIGVAIEAVDASTLKIQQTGTITRTAHGYTGPAIWLSDATSGLLTETAPTTAGHFLKPIAKVIGANTLEIVDYPATEIVATGVYSTTFTSTDSRITTGVLTVTHGLRQRPLFVSMMDGSASPVDIYPGVVYTSDDVFTVDLSAFTITGTWTLVASKGAGAAVASVASGGMWTLVKRWSPSTASTSYTFSGLNGDVDRRYKIVTHMINGAVGPTGFDAVYANSDNNSANYNGYWLQTDGSGSGAIAGWWTVYQESATVVADSAVEIFAKTGFNRQSQGQGMRSNSSGVITISGTAFGIWKNSSSNITSLTYQSRTSNGIGVGSYIELWKLAQ